MGIQLLEMPLEAYDVAAQQFPLCARGLFPVTAAAPTYQVSWTVGLGGIGEPPSRHDVIDTEFASILLLGLSAIPAPVPVAGSDPFRARFPVRGQRRKWLMTILRMPNAGEGVETPCV